MWRPNGLRTGHVPFKMFRFGSIMDHLEYYLFLMQLKTVFLNLVYFHLYHNLNIKRNGQISSVRPKIFLHCWKEGNTVAIFHVWLSLMDILGLNFDMLDVSNLNFPRQIMMFTESTLKCITCTSWGAEKKDSVGSKVLAGGASGMIKKDGSSQQCVRKEISKFDKG